MRTKEASNGGESSACLTALFIAGVVAAAPHASAQQVGARSGGPGGGPGAATIEFMAGDPAVGRLVVGAPYSGEATTTVSQTLADGTRIERTSSTRTFRDSEGRTRREQTVQGLGGLNASGETTVVTIVDPVASASYVLDPSTRKALRSDLRRVALMTKMREAEPPQPGRARGGEPPPAPPQRSKSEFDPLAPPPPPPPPPPGGEIGVRARSGGVNGPLPNVPQSLGTRLIEGIEVVGTKRVEIIPVGRIGNDRPIEITDERWESPALKVLVQSRHSDPRTGVVEYRLTNISRAEPPHDLFVVPPDYTIVEARNEERRH